METILGSRLWIIGMYREQLKTFDKLGIGNHTNHGTIITQELIDCTKKRLRQLTDKQDELCGRESVGTKEIKEKLLNDTPINGNGTVTASRMQSTRPTRPRGGKR